MSTEETHNEDETMPDVASETEDVPVDDAEATTEETESPADDTEATTEETESPADDAEATTEEDESPADDTETTTEEDESPADDAVDFMADDSEDEEASTQEQESTLMAFLEDGEKAPEEVTAVIVEPEVVEEAEPEPAAKEESAEAEAEEEVEEAKPEIIIHPDRDDGITRRWYAIHAYSGQEANVQKNLRLHAEQEEFDGLIGDVLVPMEEVAEIKSGEKKISKRKFFPGYVLARLPLHPENYPALWHAIKETPGVAGFIGSKSLPTPLEDREVLAIVEEMRGERERPKPKVNFEISERIKIIDGPFSNFLGNIDEINSERGTLKVMVEIFERLTSVEVEFWQVEKM